MQHAVDPDRGDSIADTSFISSAISTGQSHVVYLDKAVIESLNE
jgi:hypothetical protein